MTSTWSMSSVEVGVVLGLLAIGVVAYVVSGNYYVMVGSLVAMIAVGGWSITRQVRARQQDRHGA